MRPDTVTRLAYAREREELAYDDYFADPTFASHEHWTRTVEALRATIDLALEEVRATLAREAGLHEVPERINAVGGRIVSLEGERIVVRRLPPQSKAEQRAER